MKILDTGKKLEIMDLQGHFLIAMPGMADVRFDRSVIYICTHSDAGAMGLIVNKLLDDISFEVIVRQLIDDNLAKGETKPKLEKDIPIYLGGPVEQGRGFVLHSAEYKLEHSLEVDLGINLTASIEILEDIAHNAGPDQVLLSLGYAGWGAGQLEAEMAQNSWLNCQATPEILFEPNPKIKYDRALALMGVDAALLSAEAGHG